MDLSKAIKRLRLVSGLTQVELASGLGIAPTTIHRYEAGTSRPGPAVLRDLLTLASRSAELEAEQDLLQRALEERTSGTKQSKEQISSLFDSNRRYSLPPLRRALLDVNVLVSLSQGEHDILEAVLTLARSKDETAKRVLLALVAPWLPRQGDEQRPEETDAR
jgi:transcriptional regulator with XRE-family HTH domain